MRIKTKVISLVAGVLFGSCAFCGTFAVNQYMNASIRKLADVEMEKLELAERAFSQVGTKEDLDAMDEAAREAYLRYQFERCYQEGYALLKGRECIKNMTKYEITAPEALGEKYVVQPLGIAYLLILKKELPFLKDFWVLSVQDITSTWEEGKEQAKWYLVVFLFVFACSITIAAAVIGHMLKALVELRDQAERIKNGDFNKKVVLTSKDELKDLSDSLNRMSDQLQQQIEDLEFLLGSLAAICRSAGRLDEMSGKLLQLIGFYGNEKIVKKPVELVDVMMWIYEENRETLIDKGIDFKIVLENTVGVQKKIEFEQKEVRGMAVQGDPMLLVSLFSNLVSNSIKALEGSGKIQIILIPEKHKVCVQDNGVGIPSKDLPHVTKAFYMVDKSRSRRQQGSGLGLALVQRISKVHGAKIEIESRLKEGTKVWICFPSSD